MQIVQPTTASQIFHVLRLQMVRNLRKPLIIFTPKSLLRNKDATSPVSEFTKGSFQTVIPENKALKADKVKRVLVCSGKVYYDLVKKREELGADDVAILRVRVRKPRRVEPAAHRLADARDLVVREPVEALLRLRLSVVELLLLGAERLGRRVRRHPTAIDALPTRLGIGQIPVGGDLICIPEGRIGNRSIDVALGLIRRDLLGIWSRRSRAAAHFTQPFS
jgi:hypothetical protein